MKTLAAAAVCVSLLCGSPVHAQGTWPEKPVRIIVPSPTGGGADAYARLMAFALSEALRVQFIVENRPGGNGNIGAEDGSGAARIEEEVVVTRDGCQVVTNFPSDHLIS